MHQTTPQAKLNKVKAVRYVAICLRLNISIFTLRNIHCHPIRVNRPTVRAMCNNKRLLDLTGTACIVE